MTHSTRIVGALALLLLVGCAGCTDDEEETKQAAALQPIAVREQASSIIKGDDGYVVNWAGVLANTNPWHFGEHVVATVVAKNSEGKEVVRLEQPLDAVPPAGTLPFTGQVVTQDKPAAVSIAYRPARWHQAGRIVSAFQPFPVREVLTDRTADGDYLVTGYVGTPYVVPARSLAVTALLRDKRGKLLGGGSTFVDNVQAGQKRRFILQIKSVEDTRDIASAEVTARTWGSSSRPFEQLALGGSLPLNTAKPKMPPFAKDRGRQAPLAGAVRQ
ncbi:hypothetical protein AB0F88_36795 [Streptosporangium sp. NPDC023963]|uniref:hypothetical protein n=1 Tax=Streptosporangium sp. NPDC023963 TaxID=3155608 RepID=UPI00342E79B1